MQRPDHALTLIDVDHTPTDQHRALVRVLARVATELGRPAEADLLVSRADAAWLTFPTRAWTPEPAGVWRGVFAVPAAIVERAEFGFALSTAGHTLPLPHPGFAAFAPPALTVEHLSRLTGGRLRTRAVALATALAVTTASSPALALAGQGVAPAPAGQGHAAREHIEQLAVFAVERGRAEAARRRARAASASPRSASRRTMTGPVRASHGGLTGRTTGTPAPSYHAPAIASASTAPATAPASTTLVTAPVSTTPASTTPTTAPASTTPASTAPVTAPASTTPAGPPVSTTSGSTPAAPPAPATTGTTPSIPAPPTTPTTPGTTTSAGAAPVATGTAPAPAVTTPSPGATPAAPGTLSPVVPPRLASSGHERSSHPQLPITPPSSKGNGGGPLQPRGNRARRGTHRGASKASGGTAITLTPSPPGFLGPKSWTGTVVNDPSLQGLLGNLSAVLHDINRPPRFLVPIYMEAGRRYDVPWPVLAAINSVETDYGRNLNTSSAGAIGWMQFEPSTWKEWGVAVDGHNVANPYDPRDAIFSAARYLAAAGAATDISRAILAYNHADWYVNMVIARARAIAGGVHPRTQTNRRGVIMTFFDQWRGQLRAPYRGGYLTHYTRMVAAANMVSAANFPYSWGGGHEQPARFGPFDCSGTVSYVLQQAGYRVSTSTSGNVQGWHFPAGPGRVTIFYNATHTFMRIGHRYFGTSTSRPGGGAGWIGTDRLPESYLADFHEVHVPGLRGDAFAAARRDRPATERRAAHATHPAPLRLTPLPAQTSAKLQLTFPSP